MKFYLLPGLILIANILPAQKCVDLYKEANQLYLYGMMESAISKIDEFIDCNPEAWQGYHIKARLIGNQEMLADQHTPSLDTNKLNAAEQYYIHSLELVENNEDEAMLRHDYADLLYTYQVYERAITESRKGMKLADEFGLEYRYYSIISDAYMRTERKDSARHYLMEGMQFDPSFYASKLGYLYIRNLQYDSAFKYLNMAYTLNPEYTNPLSNLGYCALEIGKYEKAIEIYEKLKSEYPREFQSQNNLGYAYLKTGNREMALENFMIVRKVYPWNSFLYRNWGVMKLLDKDTVAACRNFKLATEIEYDPMFLREIKKVTDSCAFCSGIYGKSVKDEVLDWVTDPNSVLLKEQKFAVATYLMLLEEAGFKFVVGMDCSAKKLKGDNKLIFSSSDNSLKWELSKELEKTLDKKMLQALNDRIIESRFRNKQYHFGVVESLEKIYERIQGDE